MNVKKALLFASAFVLILSAAVVAWALLPQRELLGEVRLVPAPEQSEAVTPEWAVVKVFTPEDLGENLALGKETSDNGHIGPYVSKNAVDGDPLTYYEGTQNAYPNELVVDLGETLRASKVRILLNPDSIWAERTQTLSILKSLDGESYTVIAENAACFFDPILGGNQAVIDLGGAHELRFLKVSFTKNTEANAGQAAELQIYS